MIPAGRATGRQTLLYGLVLLGAVASWWALSAMGVVDDALLPSPPAALRALRDLAGDPGGLLSPVGATTRSVLAALAVAAPIGLLVGVIVGSGPVAFRALEPWLAHLNTVPLVLLYPLLLGALGSGPTAKIVVGAIGATLATAISTAWAAQGVDQELVAAARSMGAARTAVVRKVVFPTLLPGLSAGLRNGTGLAVVTVVAGEFISSTKGLGYELARTSESFQTPQMFAWLIVTAVFAAAVVTAVNALAAVLNRRVRR